MDGADPVRREPIGRLADTHEERKVGRSWHLAVGTIACPRCDAPVALGPRQLAPADALDCPYCDHRAAARDFLSLASPTRPARVEVRVLLP